ncbi:MAG: T9SS type A sorting domain-containing protein [Bacteroidota bacterium]
MKQLLLSSGLLLAGALCAQSVSFTLRNDLISDDSETSYNDCVVDMNGDYLDDIVRVRINGIDIDYQQPGGVFTSTFHPVAFNNLPSWSICAGDLDQNGYNDLLFGGGSRVSFIMANDFGTAYTENLIDDYIFSQRSTMADIDGDGDLDAFVCHDVDQSHPYRNDGTGNMVEDQSLIPTVPTRGNYAAIWTDYDLDGDIDLHISKCVLGSLPGDPDRTNALYRNNGDGTFTEIAAQLGLADNEQTWVTSFEDFDNDGDFDIFVLNHTQSNRFFRNNGDGTYTDIIQQTGLPTFPYNSWTGDAADFNNDGYIDILADFPGELYLNNGDLTFSAQGLPFDRGGIGDLNNDGFLDVMRENSLYLNNGNTNNWVKFTLEGSVTNTNGIGSRIEIYGDWGVQLREVRSGQSFEPMNSLNVHFGLGAATEIDSVLVHWPSGQQLRLEQMSINTTHPLIETSCQLPTVNVEVSGSLQLCPGTSVELSIAPTSETVTWTTGETTPNITVDQTGNYRATVLDQNGCLGQSETIVVTMAVDEAPSISVLGSDVICGGETVTLQMSGSNNNPVWSDGTPGEELIVTQSGNYFVQTEALCSTQSLVSNVIYVEALTPSSPFVTNISVNTNNAAQITAIGGDLNWYATPTTTDVLGSGPFFTTPPLDEDATFYVDNTQVFSSTPASGGKADYFGPGGTASANAGIYFDAWETFTLQSVEVRLEGNTPAQRTVQLLDGNGNVLEEYLATVNPGENTLPLNFTILPGTGYLLNCPEGGLFRNNGQVNYPYPISDLGEITNSPNGPTFYYYFYNWQVQAADRVCTSPRLPVEISLVNIENADVNPLSCGGSESTIQVNFSGGTAPFIYTWSDPSITGANPENVPPGTYTVTITDTYGSTDMLAVEVPVIELLEVYLLGEDSHCGQNDGVLEVEASGGVPPYTYDWEDDAFDGMTVAENLPEGDYWVVVSDAIGCVSGVSTTILSQPGPSIMNTEVINANCDQSDGAISVSTSAGTAPFTYDWDVDNLDGQANPQQLVPGTYTLTITDANGCTESTSVAVDNIAGQSITSVNTTDATCDENNGGIGIIISGGTAPLVYDWNNDALDGEASPQNLSAGAYELTITDANGCIATTSATVGQQASPSIEAVETVATDCDQASGSISLTISGGTAPLAYDWNDDALDGQPNAADLSAGTYLLTVTDANGCTATTSAQVDSQTGQTIEAVEVVSATCGDSNGSISLSLSGGTAPFTYDWNADALDGQTNPQNLSAGTYTLTITDANGCTANTNTTVGNQAGQTIEVVSTLAATCEGSNGSISVDVAGGTAPFTYDWDEDDLDGQANPQNLSAGSYALTITDANGCAATTSATVANLASQTIETVNTLAATCDQNNGSINLVLSGGTAPFAYDWDDDNLDGQPNPQNLNAGTYALTVTDANGCTVSTSTTVGNLAGQIIETVNTLAATCEQANGSIDLTLSGGTAPFTYDWSDDNLDGQPNPQNLDAGTYALTVTDANGCTASTSTTVANLASQTIEAVTVANANCDQNDGSISLDISGGTVPFTYDWNVDDLDGIAEPQNLSPGTYTLTVTDANGCVVTTSASIDNQAGQSIEALTLVDANCGQNDGSIQVDLSGGTAPFAYDWSDDVYDGLSDLQNLFAGDYALTITDANGCVVMTAATLADLPGQIIAAVQLEVASCGLADGEVELAVEGGVEPYIYEWSAEQFDGNAAPSNVPAGNYTVTVTDQRNCLVVTSVEMNELPSLTLVDTVVTAAIAGQANGQISLTIADGTAPFTYDWSADAYDGQANPTNLAAGPYDLLVTDANGCTATASFWVEELVKAFEVLTWALEDLNIYPNPSSGAVQVQFTLAERKTVRWTVFNALGQTVQTDQLPHIGPGTITHALALHDLPSGVYWLRLSSEAGQVLRKVVLER